MPTGLVFLVAPRAANVSFPFLASRNHLHSLARGLSLCGLFLSNLLLPPSHLLLQTLISRLPPMSPLQWHWAHLGNPGYPSRLTILNFIPSAKSLVLYQVTYSQVWGLGCGHLWWGGGSLFHPITRLVLPILTELLPASAPECFLAHPA